MVCRALNCFIKQGASFGKEMNLVTPPLKYKAPPKVLEIIPKYEVPPPKHASSASPPSLLGFPQIKKHP